MRTSLEERQIEMSYNIITAMSLNALKGRDMFIAVWGDRDDNGRFKIEVSSTSNIKDWTSHCYDKFCDYMSLHSLDRYATVRPICCPDDIDGPRQLYNWILKYTETAWLRIWESDGILYISTSPGSQKILHP